MKGSFSADQSALLQPQSWAQWIQPLPLSSSSSSSSLLPSSASSISESTSTSIASTSATSVTDSYSALTMSSMISVTSGMTSASPLASTSILPSVVTNSNLSAVKTPSHAGPIAGGIVAAVSVLSLVCALFYVLRKRSRRRIAWVDLNEDMKQRDLSNHSNSPFQLGSIRSPYVVPVGSHDSMGYHVGQPNSITPFDVVGTPHVPSPTSDTTLLNNQTDIENNLRNKERKIVSLQHRRTMIGQYHVEETEIQQLKREVQALREMIIAPPVYSGLQ